MIEALIGRGRRRVHLRRGLRDENIGAAELEVDARLALLHRAQHFGAEHALVPLRRLLRIGAAQMHVVIGERGHVFPPVPLVCEDRPSIEAARAMASYPCSSSRTARSAWSMARCT